MTKNLMKLGIIAVVLSLTGCHLDVSTSEPGLNDDSHTYSCNHRVVQLEASAYDNGCPKITDLGELIAWSDNNASRDTMHIGLRPFADGHYPRMDRITYRAFNGGTTTDRDLKCTTHDQTNAANQRVYECVLPHDSSGVTGVDFYLAAARVSSETCFSTSTFSAGFEDSRCGYRTTDATEVVAGGVTMPVLQPQS